MKGLLSLLIGLGASPAMAQPAAAPQRAMIAGPAIPALGAGKIFVQQDTPIRLMVLNEVSTRTAKPGDRFVLRVDEPVVVDGTTIIATGAKAWGEVLDAQSSGHVGKAGRISARLLSVEVGGQQIPINGENKNAGDKGTTQVALGMLGLGPLALLARGNNAKLKAGEIFSAYFSADMMFDKPSSTLLPLEASAGE